MCCNGDTVSLSPKQVKRELVTSARSAQKCPKKPSHFISSMASSNDRPSVEVDANVDATEDPVDNPSYVLRRLYEEVCPFRVSIRFADGIYHCSSKLSQ